ncbi:alpha/beta fold hydrolase [Arthrobacter sp. 35W]|uniref:alpha/beta fold hydrolase n=1 Tax=Arthrobacter sp. 35W TaxID=1132441 RepID=UPI00041CECA7|nr:alpha/beta hydrolase [Arthrobacter sp. 35W]
MVQKVQSVDGTTIAYERAGKGAPLVIVGGALNNRQSAAGLASLLAKDFTVFRYDRRGRGDSSDARAYAVDREIDDLRALADAAGAPVNLYGHSSGAILALEAAAAGLPVARIAAYEPPYFPAGGRSEPWQAFVEKVRTLAASGRGGEAVEAFIRHTGADFDPGMKKAPFWPSLAALAHTLPYDLTLAADGAAPVVRLSMVAAPVLALYGGSSPDWAQAAATAVAAAVQDGRVDVVADQDHSVADNVLAPVLRGFFS